MFTQQENEIISKLKAEGKTPQQIAGYIGGLRTNAPSSIAVKLGEKPKEPDEGVLSRIAKDAPSDVVETVTRAFGATNDAGKGMVETFNDPNLGKVDKAVKIGSQAFKGIGRFLGETFLGAAKLGTTDKFEKDVAGATAEVADAVVKSDFGQDVIKWYDSQDEGTKEGIKNVLGYGEFLASVTGGGIAGKGTSAATRGTINVGRGAVENAVTLARQGKAALPIRIATATLDDAGRKTAVDKLASVYKDALVENRQSINNKLDELARGSSFGEKKVTRDDLIYQLAEEGYIPEVDGRLARFQDVFDDISTRQSKVMEALEPILANSKASIKTDELYKMIDADLVSNPQIAGGLTRSQAELTRLFDSYRQKFGDTLNATQVNEIRKESNSLTSAFKDSDKFSADTSSQVGRSTRRWLDENVPDESARKANAEWARLNSLRETAQIFDNQQIDVGIWGRALGSYVTTVAGAGAGLAVGGPVLLAAAAILTKMGGDKFADMLRKKAFSPEIAAEIRNTLRKDDKLVEELMKTAEQQNKDAIKDFLLPAAGESGYRSEVSSGKTIEAGGIDASGKKVEPGITERVAPGAIKVPKTTRFLEEQARRYKTADAFLKTVKNNPAWEKKFAEAETTPEEIASRIFGNREKAQNAALQVVDEDIFTAANDIVRALQEGRTKKSLDTLIKNVKKQYGMSEIEGARLEEYIQELSTGMPDIKAEE